jgi:hypothetical protein
LNDVQSILLDTIIGKAQEGNPILLLGCPLDVFILFSNILLLAAITFLLLNARNINKLVHYCVYGESRNTVDAQLARNVASVRDYRVDGNVEFVGNLFVGISFCDGHKNVALSCREFV